MSKLDAVIEALSKLYECYYAHDLPESARWTRIKELLGVLMEAYDELLD
jgi:hypothetical protein